MGHDESRPNGVVKGQQHSENQPWRSEAISCPDEICWLSSEGEIVQESLMKFRPLKTSRLFPTDTVKVLFGMERDWWDAKRLFARWLAAPLGISWTDCEAKMYFGSWTQHRILERNRDDDHKRQRIAEGSERWDWDHLFWHGQTRVLHIVVPSFCCWLVNYYFTRLDVNRFWL